VIQRSIQVSWELRVFFTEDVFAASNLTLHNALADAAPRKVLAVIDESLALAQPNLAHQIENYFAAHATALQLVCPPANAPKIPTPPSPKSIH
jgi:3-dehydroquinate synthase